MATSLQTSSEWYRDRCTLTSAPLLLLAVATTKCPPEASYKVLKVYTHYSLPELEDGGVGFNCFPISAHLRDSCPDLCEKMSVFGLRLASQETRARYFFLSLSLQTSLYLT